MTFYSQLKQPVAFYINEKVLLWDHLWVPTSDWKSKWEKINCQHRYQEDGRARSEFEESNVLRKESMEVTLALKIKADTTGIPKHWHYSLTKGTEKNTFQPKKVSDWIKRRWGLLSTYWRYADAHSPRKRVVLVFTNIYRRMDEFDRKDVGRCCDSVYPLWSLCTQSPDRVISHMTWQDSVKMYLNLHMIKIV